MINNILIVVASALLTANAWADNVIPAEVPTAVELSNHDINRIVCPGKVDDLIYSQEKPLTGHFSGNSAFVKFKIEDTGEEYIYAESSQEVFVVCNGTVYHLIATPKDIPSPTLRLAPAQGETMKSNIAHHKNLPLEKRALQIIREAYNNTYPSSYKVTEPNNQITLGPDLETSLVQAVAVDGVGLQLRKFQVKSLASKPIKVDEQRFLTSAISDSILAVAVEDHTLSPGEITRVFVVEKKETVE